MQIQLLLLDSNVDVFFEKEKEMKWNRLRCVVPCVKWVCISIHFIVDDFALNSVVLITSVDDSFEKKNWQKILRYSVDPVYLESFVFRFKLYVLDVLFFLFYPFHLFQ